MHDLASTPSKYELVPRILTRFFIGVCGIGLHYDTALCQLLILKHNLLIMVIIVEDPRFAAILKYQVSRPAGRREPSTWYPILKVEY